MKSPLSFFAQADKRTRSIILVVAFALVGAAVLVFTQAAVATASLTITPPTGPNYNGSNFTVSIYENSTIQAVNSVSIGMTYDDSKLDFVGVSTAGSPFGATACLEASGANGKVSITCYISPTATPSSVTGNQFVANVTFTARAGSGTAALAFVNESAEKSAVFAALTGENVWDQAANTVNIPLSTPDTTAPTINWTAPASAAVLSGTSVPVTAGITDATSVSSANLFIGSSTTAIPMTGSSGNYSANWSLSGVVDGSYVLTIKAKDPAGNEAVATRTVQVLNARPNLVVATPTLSIPAPNSGDLVTVSAVVTNSGTAAITAGTAYAVTLTDNTTIIGTINDTAGLAVGASKSFSFTTTKWTATNGNHNILVEADKNKVITESNENDNIGTKTLVVYTLGDTNNTGTVTVTDLNIIINNFGQNVIGRVNGDLNGDGKVTITDLNQVINNWTR